MRLTENKIEYDGCVLFQVARYNTITHQEELGGYIEKSLFKTIDNSGWIDINSYVYRCSLFTGKFFIHKNVTIHDSIIQGNFIIRDNVEICGSNISTRHYHCVLDKNSKVLNKKFVGNGLWEEMLFNDGEFKHIFHNGIDLTLTTHYCKIGCLTLSYYAAWNYLTNETSWKKMEEKYKKESPNTLFTINTKHWLTEQCETQLKKLRQE